MDWDNNHVDTLILKGSTQKILKWRKETSHYIENAGKNKPNQYTTPGHVYPKTSGKPVKKCQMKKTPGK